ncbi:hypothetical protein JCM11641_007875 [Rhodosporidiobolus odoratus]
MPRTKQAARKGRGGSNKSAVRTDSDRNATGGNYQVVNQTNDIFENYYKQQAILPDDEWDAFIAALKEPLPTTFRLTASRPTATALNEHIKQLYVPFLTGIEFEGKQLAAPQPLKWYPQQLAWQLPVPKQALRKHEAMKKFQHFLVYETDAGNISRQEAVSMIPPLLLDVQPGHTALDMCAAPGSKSVQILEALHGPSTTHPEAASVPKGLLIANDSDAKRCHLLVHQSLHRVPGTGMMVTNHDATQLPSLRLPKTEDTVKGRVAFTQEDEHKLNKKNQKEKAAKEYEPMLFDRILADVPCSGDGTLRKNLGIWKDWTVGNGIGLHALQLRILERGIALLKPGGRLVYSTCSMNPMENESVISAALSLHPEMSILPVPSELPGLLRRPGLTDWQVLDNSLSPAPHPDSAPPPGASSPPPPPSLDDVVAVEQDNNKGRSLPKEKKGGKNGGKGPNNVDKKGNRKAWAKTLWPVGDEKEKGLEHCLRLYPHLQDTGAFFVCVLVKKGEVEGGNMEVQGEVEQEKKEVEEQKEVEVEMNPVEEELKEKRERASSPVDGQPEAKKVKQDEPTAEAASEAPAPVAAAAAEAPVEEKREGEQIMGAGRPFNEEPYIYTKGEQDEQVQIIRDFFGIAPNFPFSSLLVRNATGLPMRSIYLTSSLTRSILLSNAYTRMRLISCGVKLFTRQDNGKDGTYSCKWRLNSEGLEVVRPYVSEKRIVKAGNETLRQVMENVSVKFEDIKEEGVREKMKSMEPGSAILKIEKAKGKDMEMEEDLYLAFWLSKVSCNLMVEKVEKSALSLRLYNEDVTPHANGKKALPVVGPNKATSSGAATPVTTSADKSAAPSDAETAAAVDAVQREQEVEQEAEKEVEKVEVGEETA